MQSFRKLLVIGLLALACGDQAPPGPEASAGARLAEGPALTLGRTYVYGLEWKVESGFDPAHESPAGLPLAGGLHLQGELHVQAIGSHEGATMAAIWFEALGAHAITLNGERLHVEPSLLLGQRAYFSLAADGGVSRVWFGPETHSLFRHTMDGALARFDLRGALVGSNARVIPTGHGMAEVTYTRAGEPGAIRRELQRMTRFDAMADVDPELPVVEGVTELVLDGDRVPLRIDGREDVDARDGGWVFGSHDRFSATRVRFEDGAPLQIPGDLSGYIEHDPAAPRDPTEAERVLAQGFAKGLAVHDIADAVTTIDSGVLPGRGFVVRATGLLRGWPEQARGMIPIALRAESNGRQLAFELLASAGTPQAQSVMRELLGREDVRGWPELPMLVGRFAFVDQPTVETAKFVLALHTEAREAGNHTLANASLYPMGSVARAIEQTAPWLAELLHARLLEALGRNEGVSGQLAAMAGVGNLGRVDDHVRLLPLLRDDDGAIRANAATALRNMIAPDATAALVEALRDPDRGVASNALDVLAEHHYDDAADSSRLAAIVIAAAHNPEIDRAVVSALGDRIDDDPTVRTALRELATRTTDRELVARIQRLVDA